MLIVIDLFKYQINYDYSFYSNETCLKKNPKFLNLESTIFTNITYSLYDNAFSSFKFAAMYCCKTNSTENKAQSHKIKS